MPEQQDFIKTFQVAFWIASIILVLITIYINTLGWKVNSKNALNLAVKKDTNDSIDRAAKSLIELEDAACSFWMEKDSKIKSYQIINLHARLVINLKTLNGLREKPIPSNEIIMLRRHCTMDAESSRRPISATAERIRIISKNVNAILNSEIMKKTWAD
jgi:hypothetical protein